MTTGGVLDELIVYLRSQLSSTWTTSNSFITRMPDEPDNCLTLYEYTGHDEYHLGQDHPSYQIVRVQASVRSLSYATARTNLMAVKSKLESVSGALSGVNYLRVYSTSTITRLELDQQDREILVLNFEVYKEES